jgi:hypothetical protein
MLAVLVDAINVIQGYCNVGSARARRLFGEAMGWVNAIDSGHPFSFDSICDALNIEPVMLRVKLIARSGRGSSRLRLDVHGRTMRVTENRPRRRQRG